MSPVQLGLEIGWTALMPWLGFGLAVGLLLMIVLI